jgi:hypothetical protein
MCSISWHSICVPPPDFTLFWSEYHWRDLLVEMRIWCIKIGIVLVLHFLKINIGSWWFWIHPTPFLCLWNSDALNEKLEFHFGVGRSYFHLQIADLPCFLIILVSNFRFVLQVGTRHYTGEIFTPGKMRVWKWVVFPIFGDFLFSQ